MNNQLNFNYEYDQLFQIHQDREMSNYVKNYLSKELDAEEIDNIFMNATKVLNSCSFPLESKAQSKTGILIGKVQSGKTSNFLAITSLAFDNGYNVVIILGGTKNKLLEQNSDRIKEHFPDEKVAILNTYEDKDLINSETINNFIQRKIKVIIVLLKKGLWIDKLAKMINSDKKLKDQPMIIFDDEGDEASLNNLIKKNKKSPTYNEILKLKDSINFHTFLSITATPQANLLISAVDALSPDFGYLLEPGKGYCGLDVFHGKDEDKYCIEIPDSVTDISELGLTKELKNSLLHYIVGAALYKYRYNGIRKIKYSMLIHTSLEKKDHFDLYQIIKKEFDRYKDYVDNLEDYSYENFRSELISVINDFGKTYIGIPKIEEFESFIFEVINFTHINVLNDETKNKKGDKLFNFNIFIGGNILGRGLTIPNLGVTFIVRSAKGKSNVDTTLQRARWFGYKNYYIDICRVFASAKVLDHFRIIREHEIDLWETIREVKTVGEDFKKSRKVLSLSSKMNATRNEVANSSRYSFNTWNIERTFLITNELIESNTKTIEDFFITNSSNVINEKIGSFRPSIFKIIKNLSISNFYSQFLSKFVFSSESNSYIKEKILKIKRIIEEKNLEIGVDVIQMRHNATSKHNVYEGRIPEYLVGKNPGENRNYLGDRYHFNGNNILFQIHNIEDLNTGVISPTLAFHIPNSVFSSLTDLLLRDEK